MNNDSVKNVTTWCGVIIILPVWIIITVRYIRWLLKLFRNGITLGKKAFGILVINETGGPPGLSTMLTRELVGKSLSGIVFMLGFLWILIDRDRQGWHDKLMSTYVVESIRRSL